MIQELSGDFNRSLTEFESHHLSVLTDPIVRQTHTDHAEQELSRILSLRAFDPIKSRREIRKLLDRLYGGDLAAAADSVKEKVCFWTARLCAVASETLPQAKQLRDTLHNSDPERDLSVLDSLIAEADGDAAKAIRILRDREDSDSRSVVFGLLSRSQGKDTALTWFEQQDNHDDPQFFTSFGWLSWAVCMAQRERWMEASQRLLGLQDRWDEMPATCLYGRRHQRGDHPSAGFEKARARWFDPDIHGYFCQPGA